MTTPRKYRNPPPDRGEVPPPEVVELAPRYDWGPTPPAAVDLRPVGRPTRVTLDPRPTPADAVMRKLWQAVAADIEPWVRATRPAAWEQLTADPEAVAARQLRISLLRDWLTEPFFTAPCHAG